MTQEEMVKVAKSDLLAVWAVLENLVVSLDQIGGFFCRLPGVRPLGSSENPRVAQRLSIA